MGKKGLARLVFLLVFMIPVGWYLILQLFGSNNFSLMLIGEVPEACDQFGSITIVRRVDSISIVQKNYLDRVSFGANKRSIAIEEREQLFFDCIDQSEAELVLLNKEGLWGVYSLSRDGVDQLLTELDILLLQKTYGKGAKR